MLGNTTTLLFLSMKYHSSFSSWQEVPEAGYVHIDIYVSGIMNGKG